MYDCIILGGGASGVMCAIVASRKGKKVLVVDEGAFLAKKLLVTGNGKCNLTNVNASSTFYNQNINEYLDRFNANQTIEFFNDLGLVLYSDEEGRVYPYSNSAKSVVEVLNKECSRLNIQTQLNTKILSVKKQECFVVHTDQGEFKAGQLVIAIGAKNAQNILNNLNVGCKEFTPSLTALLTENTKKLSGIRLSGVEITAKCKNKIFTEKGEVLFKDSGLSGIVVFNASTLFARNNCFKGEVSIKLMPNYGKDKIIKMLTERLSKNIKLKDVFNGWFMEQIAVEICAKANIDINKLSSKISQAEVKKLADTICDLRYNVKGHYDNNQVYSGGVCLNNLTNNLQSREVSGLYFCGEVCDVDGTCGGYNLQWAWTSGKIVGDALWLRWMV